MSVPPQATSPTTGAVLTFGEALVGYASTEETLRTASRFSRFLGGADLNVAVGLTRLGVSATWASVLGDDAHGDYVVDTVQQLGVGQQVRRAPGPTALMFKAGGAGDDPEVLQVRHDTAFARHASHVVNEELVRLDGIGHLHLTGIVFGISPDVREAALRLLDAATAAGIPVSFDPNLRLNLWPDHDAMRTLLNSVAARATVVLPGLAEGELLTGRAEAVAVADFYLAAGAQEVAVKLGARGAQAWCADGEHVSSGEFRVQPVDTVGAGDGFAAGYLAARLSGGSLQERVDQAAAVGALVITRRGDLAAMPTRDELEEFLRFR